MRVAARHRISYESWASRRKALLCSATRANRLKRGRRMTRSLRRCDTSSSPPLSFEHCDGRSIRRRSASCLHARHRTRVDGGVSDLGFAYLGIRYALEGGWPPLLAVSGGRMLFAGALMYAVLRWRGVPSPQRAQWPSLAVMGLLMMLFGNGMVVLAEEQVSSGLAAIAIASMPLWMGLFGALEIEVHGLNRRARRCAPAQVRAMPAASYASCGCGDCSESQVKHFTSGCGRE